MTSTVSSENSNFLKEIDMINIIVALTMPLSNIPRFLFENKFKIIGVERLYTDKANINVKFDVIIHCRNKNYMIGFECEDGKIISGNEACRYSKCNYEELLKSLGIKGQSLVNPTFNLGYMYNKAYLENVENCTSDEVNFIIVRIDENTISLEKNSINKEIYEHSNNKNISCFKNGIPRIIRYTEKTNKYEFIGGVFQEIVSKGVQGQKNIPLQTIVDGCINTYDGISSIIGDETKKVIKGNIRELLSEWNASELSKFIQFKNSEVIIKKDIKNIKTLVEFRQAIYKYSDEVISGKLDCGIQLTLEEIIYA
ncbi:hypothetical protein CPJCM30710_17970 [Clostridium polyendosporum]|uniref:Uncharacterized protein n=1 Tax=Clostridium polyendosporum TaxID=69208 RepID=A0A919VGY9_9CLOT|nr:hypothetical protein [Clostridium polyendosporum]GIM29131.1 hypothetical protein CPJCM30710_17970 [Clostridium polyendosporum]